MGFDKQTLNASLMTIKTTQNLLECTHGCIMDQLMLVIKAHPKMKLLVLKVA